MTGAPGPRATIVVGVDGSPSSEQALRWALRQAEVTGGEVHAVTVWQLPTTAGWDTPLDAVDWAANARLALDTALGASDPEGSAPVRRDVVEGHAARVLVELAENADLLVVGSRGRGAFTGMLTGSVALHVLAHARCPVVVVHGDRLPGRPDPATSSQGTGALTG
jgi:nucleotide-binding universal stress UspA family protein